MGVHSRTAFAAFPATRSQADARHLAALDARSQLQPPAPLSRGLGGIKGIELALAGFRTRRGSGRLAGRIGSRRRHVGRRYKGAVLATLSKSPAFCHSSWALAHRESVLTPSYTVSADSGSGVNQIGRAH